MFKNKGFVHVGDRRKSSFKNNKKHLKKNCLKMNLQEH